uniref:Uncharacterized protein n=1 Tax=Oryza punctata TaxID=4537 RepID=A0A0E0M554_ORYPU
MKETAQREDIRYWMTENKYSVVVNEQKIEKFLYTMFKLNSTILGCGPCKPPSTATKSPCVFLHGVHGSACRERPTHVDS